MKINFIFLSILLGVLLAEHCQASIIKGSKAGNPQLSNNDDGSASKIKLKLLPDSQLLMIRKNIEFLNFQNPSGVSCCSQLTITRPQALSEVITADQAKVLVISNYGQGKAAVLTTHLLFQDSSLQSDQNWVFLLKNLINYITKTPQKKYEILALGITPTRVFKQLLNRSGLDLNITFVWNLEDFPTLNNNQFHVILIGQYSLEEHQKITKFVSNGGGIITTFRPGCQGCYDESSNCESRCLHNYFLQEMGIKFNDLEIIQRKILKFNATQRMNLTKIPVKKYEKNSVSFSSLSFREFADDYKSIIKGVEKLSYPKAAYSSFRYSEESFFPVIKKDKKPIMIAGKFGSGKLFFQGHGTLLERAEADNLKFLSNIVKWLCGNKTTPKVGFLFIRNPQQLVAFLKLPIDIIKSEVSTPEGLREKDLIIVSYIDKWPINLTATMLSSLKKYVQSGGSILFASHGWVWRAYGEGSVDASLIYQQRFGSFVIAKQFEVFLQQDAIEIQHYLVVKEGGKNIDLDNFLQSDFLQVLKGQLSFSANDSKVNEYISNIQQALDFSTISDIETYHNIVNAFVLSRFNIEKYYDQIDPSNPIYIKVYKLMNALSYAVPASECRALPPSLNKFPGQASQIIPKKTNIYKNMNERIYTGLYINPGSAIRVTHTNSFEDVIDINLCINHGDQLYDSKNGNLKRFPDVVSQFPIKSKDFIISSPHGGILYFRVLKKSNFTKPLSFQIFGAYEAPYFNENLHTPAQFALIRKIDAPIFVIQTKKFVHIGPTLGIFGSIIINISKLSNFWNKVIQTYKIYRGNDPSPFQKDSFYNDVNIALGYMHSGNPVMTFDDLTLHMLGWKNVIFQKGSWGIYHQLGHNHQDYKWTTSGTVQVTCNIYSLYLTWVMNKVQIFKNQWLMQQSEAIIEKMRNYMKLPEGQKLSIYNDDPRLALFLYAILMDEIGMQIFSNLHKKYDSLNFEPKSDAEKYELLVEQLSLVVGRNLWNYFKRWGMPVSEASKTKIQHLPTYECSRYPFINH